MKFDYKGKEYYIDGILASRLMSLVYNLNKDHDFIIIITGDRTVRVGKSVMGLTVCAFLASLIEKSKMNLNPFSIDNIYFDNKEMLKKALVSPPFTIHQYDEGREGLSAGKHSKDFQKDLLDFFAECGQLNNIFVVVLPDFFDLKEDIGVARSEFLINVYRKETPIMVDGKKYGLGDVKIPAERLDRGFFEFFSRKKKAMLYDISKSKHQKRYNLTKCNFYGRFTNQYPIDEEAYRNKKMEALKRFVEKKQEQEKKEKDVPPKIRAIYEYLKEKDRKAVVEGAKETGAAESTSDKWLKRTNNKLKASLEGTSTN